MILIIIKNLKKKKSLDCQCSYDVLDRGVGLNSKQHANYTHWQWTDKCVASMVHYFGILVG